MKKLYFLIPAAMMLSTAAVSAADFQTAGTGTSYTLAQLAQTDGAPVARTGNLYTISENVIIAPGDKFVLQGGEIIQMADKVQIEIQGTADMAPASMVIVTRASDDAKPQGFRIDPEGTKVAMEVKNISFEYAAIKFWCDDADVTISDCNFRYVSSSYGAAICMAKAGQFNIRRCNFLYNPKTAFTSGANIPVGLLIENCTFVDNNQENANKPQLNLTVGGDRDVIVRNNVILGTGRSKVGGIAIGNMMSLPGKNHIEISGNDIRENRYGITGIGPMDMDIFNNVLVNNNHETNAMNGGSGMSLNGAGTKLDARVWGNHIENHLWGITIIKCNEVCLGKVGDASCPGGNTFKDNGNGGVLYDVYNNQGNTVYAQNNTWNVAQQTADQIETVVYHKADNSSLGEVIYMPAADDSGISQVEAAKAPAAIEGNDIVVASGIDATASVYNVAGQKLASIPVVAGRGSLASLSAGATYVIRVADASGADIATLKHIR